jgi:hypothetical protein
MVKTKRKNSGVVTEIFVLHCVTTNKNDSHLMIYLPLQKTPVTAGLLQIYWSATALLMYLIHPQIHRTVNRSATARYTIMQTTKLEMLVTYPLHWR